jgi:ribosome maturation factor RimP
VINPVGVLGLKRSIVPRVSQLGPSTNVVSVEVDGWDHVGAQNILHESDRFSSVLKSIEIDDVGRVSNRVQEVLDVVAVLAIVFCEDNSEVIREQLVKIWVIWGELSGLG